MTRAEAEKFYNSLSPEERQYLHEFISYKQSEITNGNATNRHAGGAGVCRETRRPETAPLPVRVSVKATTLT